MLLTAPFPCHKYISTYMDIHDLVLFTLIERPQTYVKPLIYILHHQVLDPCVSHINLLPIKKPRHDWCAHLRPSLLAGADPLSSGVDLTSTDGQCTHLKPTRICPPPPVSAPISCWRTHLRIYLLRHGSGFHGGGSGLLRRTRLRIHGRRLTGGRISG